jgi:hypothetical protein
VVVVVVEEEEGDDELDGEIQYRQKRVAEALTETVATLGTRRVAAAIPVDKSLKQLN